VKKLKFKEQKPETKLLKLDLGAGKGGNTPEGFTPIDLCKWKGVKVVDLRKRWPWKANSVDEVSCHYLVNYLTATERVHFANELYRVLKVGSKAQIVTPYWCASKAYGDLRAQWPPVSESWFGHLNKGWRDAQNWVDTTGYKCNFDIGLGYGMHPSILSRNSDYQQQAVSYWKEAAQELIATITKL
jgi:hypothetical protein